MGLDWSSPVVVGPNESRLVEIGRNNQSCPNLTYLVQTFSNESILVFKKIIKICTGYPKCVGTLFYCVSLKMYLIP